MKLVMRNAKQGSQIHLPRISALRHHHCVICGKTYDPWPEIPHLMLFKIPIGKNNNPIAHNSLSRGGSVEAYLATPAFSRNCIGFKSLAIVQVTHHHQLIREYASLSQ